MTPERFSQLVDSYGGDLLRWPLALQSEASDCLVANPDLHTVLQQGAQLDQALGLWSAPAFADLEARLLQQVLPDRPRGLLDRITDWLIPLSGNHYVPWWRPAVLACLPLLLGMAAGWRLPPAQGPGLPFGSSLERSYELAFELSFEEELYFISLSDYAENL
jgi:hypothetical protein